jgi:hypothetical protein
MRTGSFPKLRAGPRRRVAEAPRSKIVEKKDAKGLSDFNDEELLAIIDGRRPDRDHAEDALGGERTISPW